MKTMKKLKRMVSVILCVIISCMCLATPIFAAERPVTHLTSSNLKRYGIVQLRAYAAIRDNTGSITAMYGPVATSSTYPNGETLVNLTIGASARSLYNYYNCNCWVYQMEYTSDSNVIYIDYDFNDGERTGTLSSTSGTYSMVVSNNAQYDYIKYKFTWAWRDGSRFIATGHFNRT